MTPNSISVETIREKTVPIFEIYPINKAILFGSYAKGNATISSDIDLYIDTNDCIIPELRDNGYGTDIFNIIKEIEISKGAKYFELNVSNKRNMRF